MQIINALKSAFQNYVNFSGRASRGDYWWYVLAYIIGFFVFAILDKMLFGGGSTEVSTAEGVSISYNAGALVLIWILANIIPSIAIAARRLHDQDRSGWMYLLALVPLVNFYLLYLLTVKGTAGENRFGPDPLAS